MTLADITLSEPPDWQRSARPRLAVAMALAAVLLAALIVLLRVEVDSGLPVELEVRLVPDEDVFEPEQLLEEIAVAEPLERTAALQHPPEAHDKTAVSEQPPSARDWQADAVVAAIVSKHLDPPSVNPGFDAKRRRAAQQFAPSRAPRKKPIWENVEIDQLGRKILVSGDCHRVIDDPSAANYDYLTPDDGMRTEPHAGLW